MAETLLKTQQALGGDGWNPAKETWTYASVDAPTGVITVPTDATTKYSVGMRVKFTQTTVKYGIITAIAATSMTIYTGTDYTLANAAITLPYYSTQKAPLGFPLDPTKWTLSAVTTGLAQTPPTANTWYNKGGSLAIHIGAWNVSFAGNVAVAKGTSACGVRATLSTANNSQVDVNWTAAAIGGGGYGGCSFYKTNSAPLVLAAKTTYYANIMTPTASCDNIVFSDTQGLGDVVIIKAVCAYL